MITCTSARAPGKAYPAGNSQSALINAVGNLLEQGGLVVEHVEQRVGEYAVGAYRKACGVDDGLVDGNALRAVLAVLVVVPDVPYGNRASREQRLSLDQHGINRAEILDRAVAKNSRAALVGLS